MRGPIGLFLVCSMIAPPPLLGSQDLAPSLSQASLADAREPEAQPVPSIDERGEATPRPKRLARLRALVGYEGQSFAPKDSVPWQSALAVDAGVLLKEHHYLSLGYRALPSINAAIRDQSAGQAASVSIARLPFSFAYGYSLARKRLRLDLELRGTVEVARTSATLIALGNAESPGIDRTRESTTMFSLGPVIAGHIHLTRSLSLVLGVGLQGQLVNRRWTFAASGSGGEGERVTFLAPAALRATAQLGLCFLLP